jgi:hypothetical protein
MSCSLPQVEGKKNMRKKLYSTSAFKKKILNEKKNIKEKKLHQVLVSTHKFMSPAF